MRHTFFCIDGHTAGNPVRLVVGGAPLLRGESMSARRQDFLTRFDWIRTGLCFEPRGHDMMSGGFLYPPTRPESDAGLLFIETSGCLPMCGHGTIGLVTFALEHGLIEPRVPGRLVLEVPAGLISVTYAEEAGRVRSVTIRNVASYVAATGIEIVVPGLGPLSVDVAYGGNFYAIVEPQGAYAGLDAMGAERLLAFSPVVRALVRAQVTPVHPLDPTIAGVSHVLWADAGDDESQGRNAQGAAQSRNAQGAAQSRNAQGATQGRNAVFYGEKAIDRSPCGTGTSARLAHLWSRGRLAVGQPFVHRSYIGSAFTGTVAEETELAGQAAIVPLIQGSAVSTGFNTIWIDREDLFWRGFQVV